MRIQVEFDSCQFIAYSEGPMFNDVNVTNEELRAADYDRLVTELARLKSENERLKACCCRWWDVFDVSEPIPVLRWIIGTVPVVLWAVDARGVILLSEGRALEPLGLESGAMVGMSVYEVSANSPAIISAIDRMLAGEKFMEVIALPKRHYESHFIPVYNSENRVCGGVGISLEIPRRELIECHCQDAVASVQSEAFPDVACDKADSNLLTDNLRGKPLTPREIEVLKEIASGLNTKMIAHKYGVSAKTVESQRRSIMRKLQLFNVVDLAKYALREGMATLTSLHHE